MYQMTVCFKLVKQMVCELNLNKAVKKKSELKKKFNFLFCIEI